MSASRRDTYLLIAMLGLAAGGAVCIAMGGRLFAPWAAALLGLSTAAAGIGWWLLRRQARALASHLSQAATSLSNTDNPTGNLPAAHGVLRPLQHSARELLDAAQRHAADAALAAKEQEIRYKVADAERRHAESIIYGISDAVLVTDAFDELLLANESAAKTFAFDVQRAHRSPVDQVLSDPRVIDLIRETRQSTRGGTATAVRRVVEHKIQTPAGPRTFQINLCPLGNTSDPTAGQSGVIAVLHDVTHEKEVAAMKNDFVSSVSHELRTPLASIKAYVELLIDGEADDEKTKREFYEVIQNEANRLSRLIDNILSISRLESGLVKVNKHPQSLTVIAKETLEVIAPQAAMKKITLAEQLAPVFYQTQGDHDMLYQAVLNLLSNAVKYTPDGGQVTLETSVDEVRKKYIVRVRDTGVGIPEKDLPHVCEKFFRAEANNRMAKGTGLGLSLVKHIVEAVHGGKMILESEVGKGSCFGFELDLCE